MTPREKHVKREKVRDTLIKMENCLDEVKKLDEDAPRRILLETKINNLYKELRYGILNS